jgi:AsmA protein
VTGITLDEPRVRLVQNKEGVWNFASLGAHAAAAAPAARESGAAQAPADLAADKVKIVNGTVSIAMGAAKPIEADSLNVEVGPLALNAAVPLKLEMKIAGGGTIALQGKIGPPAEKDATQTPLELTAQVKGLDLERTGLLGPVSAIAAVADFDGTLTSDGKTVKFKGKAAGSKMRFSAKAPATPKPVRADLDASYEIARRTGVLHSMTVRTGAAATHLAGKFDLASATPAFDMHMAGERMPVDDLAELLPSFGIVLPQGAKLQGGTLNVGLAVHGTAARPLAHGEVALAETTLANFDLASQMKSLASLAGLKDSKNTVIQELSATVDSGAEGIKVDALKLDVPAIGQLTGNGTVSPDNELNFEMVANVAREAGVLGVAARGIGAATKQQGVPFKVTGPAENPKVSPELGKFVKGELGLTKPKSAADVMNTVQGLSGLFKKKTN